MSSPRDSNLSRLSLESFYPQFPEAAFNQDAISGAEILPESPIEAFLPRPDTPKETRFFMASPSNFMLAGGVPTSLGQIQGMASELAHARNNGEFPATAAPYADVNSTAEDYEALLRLRQLRGDQKLDAPEVYSQFLVETARRIHERDTSLDETTKQGEVARRVGTYLQAVEHEQRYFNAANNILQRRGINNPTQLDLVNAGEEICSIVEQSIEQGIADATGPLRMNVGTFKQQNNVMSQQIAALNTMFEPQILNMQATTQSLTIAHGLVKQLSQVAADLPDAINQAVYTAVRHEAQNSFLDVLTAQQQAMIFIEERTQHLNDLHREVQAQAMANCGSQQRKRDLGRDGPTSNPPFGNYPIVCLELQQDSKKTLLRTVHSSTASVAGVREGLTAARQLPDQRNTKLTAVCQLSTTVTGFNPSPNPPDSGLYVISPIGKFSLKEPLLLAQLLPLFLSSTTFSPNFVSNTSHRQLRFTPCALQAILIDDRQLSPPTNLPPSALTALTALTRRTLHAALIDNQQSTTLARLTARFTVSIQLNPNTSNITRNIANMSSTHEKTNSNSSVEAGEWHHTHLLPTPEQRSANGRQKGRQLIPWKRPRMADKLLQNILYECAQAKIDLPWDHIAHRLSPGSSGKAITQFLERNRQDLIAEGHIVPPTNNSHADKTIRGFVRADFEGDLTTTRPVPFKEATEHREQNLADAHEHEAEPTAQSKWEETVSTPECYYLADVAGAVFNPGNAKKPRGPRKQSSKSSAGSSSMDTSSDPSPSSLHSGQESGPSSSSSRQDSGLGSSPSGQAFGVGSSSSSSSSGHEFSSVSNTNHAAGPADGPSPMTEEMVIQSIAEDRTSIFEHAGLSEVHHYADLPREDVAPVPENNPFDKATQGYANVYTSEDTCENTNDFISGPRGELDRDFTFPSAPARTLADSSAPDVTAPELTQDAIPSACHGPAQAFTNPSGYAQGVTQHVVSGHNNGFARSMAFKTPPNATSSDQHSVQSSVSSSVSNRIYGSSPSSFDAPCPFAAQNTAQPFP
ncbi:hypothetical protein FZEAL_9872 [Fusarium zealandicum]|uniref:Uncharacterized protein n=1 Tax=Fusarium zealandicum TaxID=1053134 RepID=A0A8H4XEG6_9HYPO|nr:hypothetical protein FZEAL_9872 [Fusarium zealandicum]